VAAGARTAKEGAVVCGLYGLELEVHDAPHVHAGSQTQAGGKKRHLDRGRKKAFAFLQEVRLSS
jgi:hypothetical protein